MPDTRPKLLIIEDDPGLQRQLRWSYDDYQLFLARDRTEAIAILRAERPPVVTLDLGLPPDPDGVTEGFATLTDILAIAPDTKVVVASGHGERESARRSIALGAWDFYQKPIDLDSLHHIVGRAFHVHRLEVENGRAAERSPGEDSLFGGLVAAAPEMRAALTMAARIAATDVAVLLTGASGTGKDRLARAMHDASPRAAAPFVSVICAAADWDRALAEAHGGTLFLDAVADLTEEAQARLLDRLSHAGDMRLLAATHRDVEAMMAEGRFRDDLYHRLAGAVIRLPALADRPGDAVLIARHVIACDAAALNPQVAGLAPDAIAAIDAWRWPGNVRELENRMRRAIILAEGRQISARDLDLPMEAEGPVTLRAAREQADREAIRHALARAEGNVSGAARLLGISRPTLYEMMKNYGLGS